jgi:hypothetical protein
MNILSHLANTGITSGQSKCASVSGNYALNMIIAKRDLL